MPISTALACHEKAIMWDGESYAETAKRTNYYQQQQTQLKQLQAQEEATNRARQQLERFYNQALYLNSPLLPQYKSYEKLPPTASVTLTWPRQLFPITLRQSLQYEIDEWLRDVLK